MPSSDMRLRCSTGQFDVVVAISEKMLDDQLKKYLKHPRVKKFSKMDEAVEGYTLSADLGSIGVTIPSVDGGCKMLYRVSIDKATLTMIDGTNYKLDKTELVFEVDVVLQNVDSKDLPSLQGLLNVPNEFSIQRLMLDFGLTETSSFSAAESSIKTDAPASALDQVTTVLQKLAASWLVHHNDVEAALLKAESSLGPAPRRGVKFPILYYAMPPSGQAENTPPGFYTPNAMTHQLYPSPVQGTDSKANCLLYLETVDKSGKLPVDIKFSNDNGVFVIQDGDSSQRVDGSMVINSKIFFENYLVPILKPVVKQAELDCVSAGPTSENGKYQWTYKFGDNVKHRDWKDDYFLMKRQQGRDDIYDRSAWFNNRVRGMENLHGWRWLGDVDIVGSAQPGETNAAKLTGRSIVNLQYHPGTATATVTGWSTMELHMRSQRDWDKLSTQIATTGKWQVKFQVEIGDKGQLNIRPTWGGDVQFTDWTRSDFGAEVMSSRDILNEFHDRFRKSLDGVKEYLAELEGKMRHDCFVMAGHGYFFMMNPMFTEKGDLLVQLRYDGIPRDQGSTAMAAFGGSQPIRVPSFINASAQPATVVAQVAA